MGIENVDDLKPGQDVTLNEDTKVTLPEGTEVTLTETSDDAHKVDENPEDHAGAETVDPWNDSSQTDWPNNESEKEGS